MPPVTLLAAPDLRTRAGAAPARHASRRNGSTGAAVVALTSAERPVRDEGDTAGPVACRVMFTTIPARAKARGHLRLVSSQQAPTEPVHGRGGPASCHCRDCTMARHPAFGPTLSVV